ncbi:MAG: Hpt domain-containing protein [Gallionellaceae bacterium]|nr:Hpt domain-containing protein [Gallionellaceae bacterium]
MSHPAQFNSLPLLSVRPGLASSIEQVSHDLDLYFAQPADVQALEKARTELHRIAGVLRMVELDGVAAYCGEIEKLLQEYASGTFPPVAAQLDIIQRALAALNHYLDALVDGASNASLRLFSPYQELQQARGMEMSFEVDLFFPDLNVELPPAILNTPMATDAAARLKAARSQFQQCLLKWLRQDNPVEALQGMRTAVVAVMACVPPDSRRAFWWIAAGLLDCLVFDGLPPELNAKGVFSRIDKQMKALLEGNQPDAFATTCEMLYLLARSHAVSEMVDNIKQTYALDAYLPEEPPLPASAVAQVLEQMRAQLNMARETWEKCTQSEDAQARKTFHEQSGQLHTLAEGLDRNTLQFLCSQIHTVAAHTEEPESAQRVAEDMAMALLLLDSGIDQYSHLGNSFHEQARILGQRLQANLMRAPEDEDKFFEVIALHSQMEERKIMLPLTTEMLGNLQHVEQVLNTFFNDPGKREEVIGMGQLLHQVFAAMHLLSLEQAERLLHVLQQTTEQYAAGTTPPKPADMRAVATALSALQSYVQNLAHGQKPDVTPLELALQGIKQAQQPTIRPAAPAPAVASAPAIAPAAPATAPATAPVSAPIPAPTPTIAPAPPPSASASPAGWEDEDLKAVFLEEAQEVLEILRTNLEISQLHVDSREPLVTIRRGFHTLKGSSRMVGLTELGEVGWATERAMNKWLEANKPASPGLLKFIGDAGRLFQAWIDKLEKDEIPILDYTALLAMAQQIENGNDALPTTAPVVSAAPVVVESIPALQSTLMPEPAPEPAPLPTPEPVPAPTIAEPIIVPAPPVVAEPEVVLSEAVSISPTLFSISTEEAAQHVAALEQQLVALRVSRPPTIEYDFMRAAHTLAGVNRTMGFGQVADLALALELWLEARIDRPFALDTAQLVLLEKTITALREMGQAISNLQEVKAQPELISQLHEDKIAPPESTSPPAEVPLDTPVVTAPQAIAVEPVASPVPPVQQPIEPPPVIEPIAQPPAPPVTEAPRPSSPVVEARVVQDDIDEDLLPIYLEEAQDLYLQIGGNLRAWKEQPGEAEFSHTLQRGLHTLKGGARMVGAMRLGELVHRMEEHVVQTATPHDGPYWEGLENYFDRVGNALERLRQGISGAAVAAAKAVTKSLVPEAPSQLLGQPLLEPITAQPEPELGVERVLPAAILRVRSDVVDSMVNEAGEISVARSRAEVEMRAFKTGLLELTSSIERLRKQLREIEIQAEGQMQAHASLSQETAEKFDPLEFDRFTHFQDLTRSMTESVHDVQTVQQSLLKNLDETTAALSTQAHLNRELQQRLMTIRMVPFSAISERLYRVVRQTSRELGKKVNLELQGSEVELDRSMLEKMTAPFEHLLRNAIAHGIESEDERRRKGKSPIGIIRLSVRQENNEVDFEFSDDGAGLDIERLRQKALEQGMLKEDDVVSESQIMQLIFASGLSTATEVTEIAGRGVGMDVVRSEIVVMGGHIDVFSERDKGARFVIRLPLTLAVAQTLMVQADHETFAIPAAMVEQVQQVRQAELLDVYRKGRVDWNGYQYSLHNLTRLIGHDNHQPETRPYNAILLLRSGERRLAVHVDDLLGHHEVVVKNIGPQLARLPGIAGATVTGNGRVVLILNPIALEQRSTVAYRVNKASTAEVIQTQPLVLVVDDSLTVRKVTSRMLIRAGYQVVTAKDGVDALEKLAEFTPAVILLDIEMPRMDGFELTKRLRGDPKTRYLPIIIITSREAEKHRLYAQELGVNAYLGKPYQEEELLEHIKFYQEDDLQQHNKFHEPDMLLQEIAKFVATPPSS